MEQDKKLAFCEMWGSLFWFLADACWLFEWKIPLLVFALPAIALNLFVFRFIQKTWANICVTASMNAWVFMNILWAWGDLDASPQFIVWAKAFCVFGLLCLLFSPAKGYADAGNALGRYFRRFRIR
ncbi:MAG: hypothetical protein A3C93_03095 [Candidatus Lloydbacteria bacterium RIFCSPHIGHO2_02_FULL_54_17]|uniref:Uncharacterized protein n=1 Tax=Candidatus Lloydbacteria bacterium RIFCSPHIGHO2_02_FULL_54_17 TaxID=1798664 RepID=A0A1G2DAK3_9BACT|nr:MAG: hypothetical protein A2762_04965 [Candidatus Lloydbacteria bacterium RIFCSPHIGHO2_01_FULL_54_11]OGZ10655.1 MAG: hypothetical protein A3C93_03095 [Candidatus Lloydbacteria bacterium RIFCSPHIGHO2_02_FULL_54_17]OGZ13690.1 MAG: hypothetical protein A2948_03285 [Candidatus Lloydbacteria bacterium RIFCSPLOWO2_01_FULL_54_18]OGZ16123.1 MAG: hypothetical protein A3H76_01745 [Candidatus Lloydbacteria bacterium RIFCSPLOWO2_02_FULL_54_12]